MKSCPCVRFVSGLLFGVLLLLGVASLDAAEKDVAAREKSPAKKATAKRPNIVLLFADDLGRYASAYADPKRPSPNDIISTPNFDRIVREGAVFDNAFVSVPSCTPSRAAINTGRHFFRNGSHSQLHFPWQKGTPDPFDKVKGMPVTLQDHGYHIGLTYKLHMRPSILGGKKNLYNRAGQRFNHYSQHVSEAKDKAAEKEKLLNEVRGNFRDFLAKRQSGQPFFYSFDPRNTHRKWVRGSGHKLWGLNPDDLKGKLPPFLPDTEVIREDMADYLGEAMAFDASCGVIFEELERLGELDNTLVVISGDHGIPGFPRGKCTVYDFGARVLLAMRWPGHIVAGRKVKTPVSLIDVAPTFLAAAGTKSVDDPNGQNLLPALATGGKDSQLRGWSLIGREVHVHTGRKNNLPYPIRALRTDKFLYIINFKPNRWPMRDPWALAREYPDATKDKTPTRKKLAKRETLVPTSLAFNMLANDTYIVFPDMDCSPTKAWLVQHRHDPGMKWFLIYAWGKRPSEELYDLTKDPYQMKNVVNDPAYAEARKKLRTTLMHELKTNHDPRLENDAFDYLPYTPYHSRHTKRVHQGQYSQPRPLQHP